MAEQIGAPLTSSTLLENRYRIRGILGQGGMSHVYLADATRLQMLVAVKENLQTSSEARAQFEREAQYLARLAHPSIPRVIDSFTDVENGRQYLVMEYIEGEDLAAMIKRVGPLPEAATLAWIRQIMDAVEYLHSRQPPMIHRDIKPANIKITPQGKAVLVDFGIAKVYDPNRGTVTGLPAVTAGYAPPEQYGFRTTQRSDIYALGATLYTMLTGQIPPDAPLRQAGEEGLVPPRRLAPISGQTEKTILRAMQVENTQRWQSVGEMRAALEGRVATPPPAQVPQPVPLKRPTASNPVVIGGIIGTFILLVLVVGVVGMTLALGSNNSTRTPAPTLAAIANTLSIPTQLPPARPSAPATIQPTLTTLPIAAPGKVQCTDKLGCIDIGANEPIHIAYAFVTSGDNSTLGLDTKYGAEIAIDDAGSKVLGHAIKFDGQDSGCSPEGGQAAATKIAADKTVVAVIGTNCSSEARAAESILLAQAGLSMISPSNTAPDLTDPAKHVAGYFRTSHNDKVQGVVAAAFAVNQLKAVRAGTINDGSIYALAVSAVFSNEFARLGGSLVYQTSVRVGDTNMKLPLTQIAAIKPDVVYYPIFVAEGGAVCSQFRAVTGLEKTVMIGSDGIFSPDFLKACGQNVVGMYFSSPNFSGYGSAYQTFAQKYMTKYKVQGMLAPFHAHSYDAMNMVLQALQKPGVVSKDADGTLHVQKQALRDAIAATDMQGITGHIKCDPNGDCADPKIAIYQVTADNFAKLQMPASPVWQP